MKRRISTATMPPWVEKATRVLGARSSIFRTSGAQRAAFGELAIQRGLIIGENSKDAESIASIAKEIFKRHQEPIACKKEAAPLLQCLQSMNELSRANNKISKAATGLSRQAARMILPQIKKVQSALTEALEGIRLNAVTISTIKRLGMAIEKKNFAETTNGVDKLNMLLFEELLRLDPKAWNEYRAAVARETRKHHPYPDQTTPGRLEKADKLLAEVLALMKPFARSFCDYGSAAQKGSPTTLETRKHLNEQDLEDIQIDAVDVMRASNRAELEKNGIGFYLADATKRPLGKKYDAIRVANVEKHMTTVAKKRLLWNLGQSLNPGGILLFVENNANGISVRLFERHDYAKNGRPGFILVLRSAGSLG